MSFKKLKLKRPPTTLPRPAPPSSNDCLNTLAWGFCLVLLGTLQLIIFLIITAPTILSLIPHPPTFHLITAELTVTSLAAGNFSGAWELAFNISNPPNGTYTSFTPISAAVISPIRNDVILADTHDVTSTRTKTNADVIEAQTRLFSRPSQTLDDVVLKRILDERALGFVTFDVEIKVNVAFIRSSLLIPIPMRMLPDMEVVYRVECKGLVFYFADDEAEEGIAKVAPGMCQLYRDLEKVIAPLLALNPFAS